MFGTKQNGFFVGAFDFDAVGLDVGVVFKGVVDDAAVEGAQRLEFDDVAPATDFFGGVFGFLNKGFAGLGAVAADVEHDFGRGLVLLKEDAIQNVLQVAECLALAANEAAGVIGLDVERKAKHPRAYALRSPFIFRSERGVERGRCQQQVQDARA